MSKKKKRKSKKKKENLIHVKLEFEEALETKRSILSMEMWLLKLTKNIETYKILRLKEMTLKENLYEKAKETKSSFKNLEKILPDLEIPDLIKKTHDTETSSTPRKTRAKKDSGIESQLLEIQKRLDRLQKENQKI